MTEDSTKPQVKPKRNRRTDTWKTVEREIAKILGGERIPVTGRTIGSAPDIRHHLFALEVKHGKQIPALLVKALKQAVASVRGEQIPMVIMHPEGARYEDSLVIIYLRDLERVKTLGNA